MSYEVEVNPYLGLLVCTLWGVVWVEDRAAALDEALERIEEGRPYRILVDMIGASCANDSHDASEAFARRLANEPKLRGCRIAYLYPDGTRINQLIERLAEERAFRFRRFATTTDALDWLLSPPTAIASAPVPYAQEPDAMTMLAGLRSGRWIA